MAMSRKETLDLALQVDEIFACKGKKVIHLDLRRQRPDDDTLARLLLGPTGNLRAPALKQGRKLIVGYDESTYLHLLG